MPNNISNAKVSKTPENKIKWDDDADRLILYADIMGFSQRVTYQEHKTLKKDLLSFQKSWKKRIKPLQQGDNLKSVQFSDSILFVVNGTNEKMFNLLTKAAICLMHEALSSGFPIKGVIAQGKFSYDNKNELYFGLPLVNAYHLHSEIYYYGIVVHHSAEQTVKKYLSPSRPYSKTKIFLKSGKTAHYHLSWHLLDLKLAPGDIMNIAYGWLDNIEEKVSGAPRVYVDNTREVLKEDEVKVKVMSEKKSLD